MMQFNVPFIPDAAYTDDLSRLGEALYAIHFSLYHPVVADARIQFQSLDMQRLIDGLQKIQGARKYLLANGRFQTPEKYRTGDGLSLLIKCLEQLKGAGVLDGIIFSDGYFVNALSMAAPKLAAQLEAIPSINFMLDSPAKCDAVLAMVAQSGFQLPQKITLDRALNRHPKALRDLADHIRSQYGPMQVELLANEGCLNHCVFRATHEAMIAAVNAGIAMDTFGLNRDLGCVHTLSEKPYRILASPFIRPEDVSCYTDVADVIKICGRTLGRDFLRRAVAAYAAGHYDGNLFDLLDAAHWMGQHWDLPNSRLPADLLDRLTRCDQNCTACSGCRDLFGQYARALPVHFDTFDGMK